MLVWVQVPSPAVESVDLPVECGIQRFFVLHAHLLPAQEIKEADMLTLKNVSFDVKDDGGEKGICLLYTSPSPRD